MPLRQLKPSDPDVTISDGFMGTPDQPRRLCAKWEHYHGWGLHKDHTDRDEAVAQAIKDLNWKIQEAYRTILRLVPQEKQGPEDATPYPGYPSDQPLPFK